MLDPDSTLKQIYIKIETVQDTVPGKDQRAGGGEDELLGVGNEQFGDAMTSSRALFLREFSQSTGYFSVNCLFLVDSLSLFCTLNKYVQGVLCRVTCGFPLCSC